MTEIVPNLYLAGLREVIDEVQTKQRGVTHILNVANEITNDRTNDGYQYMWNGVDDDDPQGDITPTLDANVAWIHEALLSGGKVMVHCWSGISRSAVTVMAYLVRYHDMSAVNAYHKVLARRPIVEPWPRYLDQLQSWAPASAETSWLSKTII